jgi:MazG family protein
LDEEKVIMREENEAADLGTKFERLAEVMARLRSPDGCPWDLEQTPSTLARHLLEEAYETVDAIDGEDWGHVAEELGDLLLQVVFQSRIAEENGRFDLGDVIVGLTEKLERRHPHIFGSAVAETAEQVHRNWERIKSEEEGKDDGMTVPPGIPSVMAAQKIQGRAARAGFDWKDASGVIDKLEEEVEELRDSLGGPREHITGEIGDLLFTVVNLARHLGVEPEQALRQTSLEFAGRFREMEAEAGRRGLDFAGLSIDEMEALWIQVKEFRRGSGVG